MKRGTPRHPKILELCELLGIKLALAVGLLELLWHFAAEFAPRGNIGRYPDKHIARALGWGGPPAKLITALTTARWIDEDAVHRLVIHDWHDHADEAVRKKLRRAGQSFLSHASKMPRHRRDGVDALCASRPDSDRLPEPEPEPGPAASRPAQGVPPPTIAEIRSGLRAMVYPERERREDTADARRLKEYEWMQSTLLEYPGARHLPNGPDDAIITKCLDAVGWDRTVARRALEAMHRAGKKPSTSWAWFVTVLAHYAKERTA
jgi:hypothetical protein